MFDFDKMRMIVVTGLREYLNCPVIRDNQNEKPPPYPYVSYGVISLMNEYNGSYGVWEDGIDRKPFTQTWSITVQSDDHAKSIELANKAQEWLDYVGTSYLNDNGVVVQSVSNVNNRDNILTIEYEYRNGFDVVFSLNNEVESLSAATGQVEEVELNQVETVGKD